MKQLNWYQIFGNTKKIPDGRTVEPTDDIQIWLHCADIWDKAYTTLYEVLNDTDTLSALMASDNAVDYLVRSTSWAVQITVPTMTSNTTPSGECFASTVYNSSYPAWKAFDGNDATDWNASTSDSVNNCYLGYEFTSPVCITKLRLMTATWGSGTRIAAFKVQGYDTEWEDIYSVTGRSDGDTSYTFDNAKTYSKYRILVTGVGGNPFPSGAVNIRTLQFYSASITSSADAMTYIGQNNYCANTLLADATWCEAICKSDYWESVLSPLVPEMTSNTTPSGIASQYGTPSGSAFEAYKAFDRSNTTHAEATFTRNDTWHVRYEFPTAVKCYVGKYIAHNPSSATYSFSMKMQRSADGVTWTDISSSTTQSISGGNTYSSGKIIFTSFDDAKYYQFCSQPNNYYAAGATEVQFYGRKDV